jgi:hypothetical protein
MLIITVWIWNFVGECYVVQYNPDGKDVKTRCSISWWVRWKHSWIRCSKSSVFPIPCFWRSPQGSCLVVHDKVSGRARCSRNIWRYLKFENQLARRAALSYWPSLCSTVLFWSNCSHDTDFQARSQDSVSRQKHLDFCGHHLARPLVWSCTIRLQVVFILRDFVLRDFALTRLENLHHFSNLRNNFRFNAIWHRRYVVALIFCRGLAASDALSRHQSRVWIDYVGDITTRLVYFPLQQHWPYLPIWVRNVNLHHPVQCKWKIGERQSVLKGNYTY